MEGEATSADGEHENSIDTNSFGCLLGETVSQMRDGTKQGLNSDTTWTRSIHKEDLIEGLISTRGGLNSDTRRIQSRHKEDLNQT